LIAVISLARTHKVAERQLELQRIAADLSAKQLEILNAEESALSKAQIDVELERYEAGYRFVIRNVGGSEARDVNVAIEGGNPVVESEYRNKIPITVLRPGKSVELLAARASRSADRYNVLVRWKNPDGSQEKDEQFVSW